MGNDQTSCRKSGEEEIILDDDGDRVLGFYDGIPWSHGKSKDPFKYYEELGFLGKGSICEVIKVRRKKKALGGSAYKNQRYKGPKLKEWKEYALKRMLVEKMSDEFLEEFRNEIEILRHLDHPHIVKAYEIFDHGNQIYVLMELCEGGDLWSRAPYQENEARKIVKQMMSAILYMHNKNLIHRDIKMENVLFESNKPFADIKLLDFGLSKKVSPGDKLLEDVGTFYTMAPEVINGGYTCQADMWSVGVLAFILLSNKNPFTAKTRKQTLANMLKANYSFSSSKWKNVSDDAKKFISSLIELDPDKRFTANMAGQSQWLQRESDVNGTRLDDTFMNKIYQSLQKHSEDNALKKIALTVIAQKSYPNDILKLRQAFDQYDPNLRGKIDFYGFKNATSNLGYSQIEQKEVFSLLDVDKDGFIDYTEFLAGTLEAQGKLEESRLAEAFDRIDIYDEGYITVQNIKKLLGTDFSARVIEKSIEELDHDKDGKLSFKEFKAIFLNKTFSDVSKQR